MLWGITGMRGSWSWPSICLQMSELWMLFCKSLFTAGDYCTVTKGLCILNSCYHYMLQLAGMCHYFWQLTSRIQRSSCYLVIFYRILTKAKKISMTLTFCRDYRPYGDLWGLLSLLFASAIQLMISPWEVWIRFWKCSYQSLFIGWFHQIFLW